MPGFQEIMIISAIVVAVIFLPRIMEPRKPPLKLARPPRKLSGRWRLAIAVTIVYPLCVAAIMQPWHTKLYSYLFIGLGPVLLGWLIFWVVMGFARK